MMAIPSGALCPKQQYRDGAEAVPLLLIA